jgi:adenosylcobinamide-GDP ribazoletransferase
MLRSFEIALGFLTVFRVRIEPFPELSETGRAAWAFPLVGMLMGGLLAAAQLALSGLFPAAVTGVLVVALWVVLTGGLHLDGWTDCWDALAAAVSRERRLEILKDSRLGTFGAVGLLFLLALKTAAVAQGDLAPLTLLLAPVAGRAVMVVAAAGSGDRGRGMAALFVAGLDEKVVRWAVILGFGPVLLAGGMGIAAAAAALLAALWFRRFALSRLGMINGDVIGGTCELAETVFLLVASARW